MVVLGGAASARQVHAVVPENHLRKSPSKDCEVWLDDFVDKPANQPHWLLEHLLFHVLINVAILLNTVEIGLTVDYSGDVWDPLFFWSGNVFTAIFTIEMLLKVCFLRLEYFRDFGNIIDFCIVATAITETWIAPLVFPALAEEGFRRLVIFRVLRLLRILRMMRLVRVFGPLLVLCKGIVSSIQAMIWVSVLLVFLLYVCSIFTVEIIGKHDYPGTNDDFDAMNADALEIWNNVEYFGNVPRSMFSLLSVCLLAEWSEIFRPILAHQPWVFPFFLVFLVFATLGLLNVIVGVIVDNTMAATYEVKKVQIEKEKEHMLTNIKKVRDILCGDNREISKDHLRHSMHTDKDLRAILSDIKLPEGFKPSDLLTVLDDDGNGSVGKEEFTEQLFRLVYCDNFQMTCLIKLAINTTKCEVKKGFEDQEKAFKTQEKAAEVAQETMKAYSASNERLVDEVRILREQLALNMAKLQKCFVDSAPLLKPASTQPIENDSAPLDGDRKNASLQSSRQPLSLQTSIQCSHVALLTVAGATQEPPQVSSSAEERRKERTPARPCVTACADLSRQDGRASHLVNNTSRPVIYQQAVKSETSAGFTLWQTKEEEEEKEETLPFKAAAGMTHLVPVLELEQKAIVKSDRKRS